MKCNTNKNEWEEIATIFQEAMKRKGLTKDEISIILEDIKEDFRKDKEENDF